jgi:hypothetical protein
MAVRLSGSLIKFHAAASQEGTSKSKKLPKDRFFESSHTRQGRSASVSNKKFKFCELCNRAYIEKRENCLLLCGSYENRPRQSTTSARRLQHWFDDHGKNPKGLLQRSRDIQAIDGDPFFAADKQD